MQVVIIGSGIAGMSAAIEAAALGQNVTILAPYCSERSQSVMAAGGINILNDDPEEGDSVESHIEDTYKGGWYMEDKEDIRALCSNAADHLKFLENMGVVFTRDKNHKISRRAFGGQSHKRTAYSGSSTGKQIVTALVQKCREYENKGQIKRIVGLTFHSALILNGQCYGVIMMNPLSGEIFPYYGDAVIIATGGQNKLFGKTTGTELCDGYAAGKLFSQGVTLRNLEFIQYHPTTIETSHKRMLITEAARGEGGRLYYMKDGKRVYFMEDQYGEKGNLMPRDIVSKCIYDCPSQVYLDISFLGKKLILERLKEVYDVCMEYINLDVTKESIPVGPSVHFFMGGISVNIEHETNIKRLYAVGECASKYHGANRLGGNSLLAAVHSGRTAARSIDQTYRAVHDRNAEEANFSDYINEVKNEILNLQNSRSKFPAVYILRDLAEIMNKNLGITRCEQELEEGIKQIDYYLDILSKIKFDPEVSLYENLRLYHMMLLAKATLLCAGSRKETRGSHIRRDYPEAREIYKKCSYVNYINNDISIRYE